jgi:hypothetical protein
MPCTYITNGVENMLDEIKALWNKFFSKEARLARLLGRVNRLEQEGEYYDKVAELQKKKQQLIKKKQDAMFGEGKML